ncbi:DUF883 family protein [Uliginosibacterium sp. H1]|uniref:DUF883 family protein n=1 Tax=Uliginosibacterium sp. H1 TaxID=3114757 RepID=UPI002E17D11B|nr:hypothetical protein [Uliginosibacterium sp. H1]
MNIDQRVSPLLREDNKAVLPGDTRGPAPDIGEPSKDVPRPGAVDVAPVNTSTAHDVVSDAKQALQGTKDMIAERATAGVTVANSFVREHPWQVLGASAVTGLFIGLLLKRRD